MTGDTILILVLALLVLFVLCVALVYGTPGRRQMRSPVARPDFGSDPASKRVGDHMPGQKQANPSDSGAASPSAWRALENDRSARDRPIYRARRSADVDELPRWDPYDEEQSRVHRVRAARGSRRVSQEPNHYELLGIDRAANDAQIEEAYRKYVALIHPDRFYDDPRRRTEAEQKLKQLNAVMEVLRDPVRRARYDAEQA